MAGPNQTGKKTPAKKKMNDQNTNANQNKNNDEGSNSKEETPQPTMQELMMLMQQTIAQLSEMFANNQLLHQEVLNLSRCKGRTQ